MEYFLSPVFNILPNLFFVIDYKKKHFVDLGPNWNIFFPHSKEHMLSTPLESFIENNEYKKFIKEIELLPNKKNTEIYAPIKNLHQQLINVSWFMSYDETNDLVFGYCKKEDLEYNFFSKTFNSIPVLISYLDINLNTLYENQASQIIFKDSHSKNKMHFMLSPYYEQCLTGKNQNLELIIPVDQDNHFRTINVQLIAKIDENGKTVGLYQVAYDISEVKNNEASAIQKEKKLNALFNNLSQGIVIQNASGRIIEYNPSALKILNLTKDQLLGKNSYDPHWKIVNEEMIPLKPEEHASQLAMNSGQSIIGQIMGVYVSRNDIHWLRVNATPLFKPNEIKPYEVIVTFEILKKTSTN